MNKRRLLIISIIYNVVVWAVTMVPLYLEQKEQGEISRESVMTIALPAAPLMIIGVIMAAIAVSPNRDGSDKVNKVSVISGIVLALGFMGYRLGMSIINE